MKTTRRIITIMLIAIMICGLFACTKQKEVNLNTTEAANRFISEIEFEETPAVIEDEEFAVEKLFGIDVSLVARTDSGLDACIAVCSSTPETVIVIKAVDAEAAKNICDNYFASRVESYRHDYDNYGPEQIAKLDGCINKAVGEYAFLLITNNNSAAENLLNDLTK